MMVMNQFYFGTLMVQAMYHHVLQNGTDANYIHSALNGKYRLNAC